MGLKLGCKLRNTTSLVFTFEPVKEYLFIIIYEGVNKTVLFYILLRHFPPIVCTKVKFLKALQFVELIFFFFWVKFLPQKILRTLFLFFSLALLQ